MRTGGRIRRKKRPISAGSADLGLGGCLVVHVVSDGVAAECAVDRAVPDRTGDQQDGADEQAGHDQGRAEQASHGQYLEVQRQSGDDQDRSEYETSDAVVATDVSFHSGLIYAVCNDKDRYTSANTLSRRISRSAG